MKKSFFHRADRKITAWMAHNGIILLRISIGIVFLWFGVLKFFPALSPAEGIAARTISLISFGIVPPGAAVLILAIWETLIGLGLIFRLFLRTTLLLLYLQMLGTLSPLFLFPHEMFDQIPFVPTLEGQYIIKNLILISAGIAVGGTLRGGFIVPEPVTREEQVEKHKKKTKI